MKPLVSVIIPTARAHARWRHMLKHVSEGLRKQTYRNFEVVVVFKLIDDETANILREFSKDLPVKTIMQKDGFVPEAYNLGIENASGEIIAFLDDDAVPYPNWLEEYVKTYNKYDRVGGVSGTTESANLTKDGKITRVPEDSVYPHRKRLKYYDFPWSRPLNGMSNWLIYFGKDGLVHHSPLIENKEKLVLPSLLYMGANMSVKSEALEGIKISENSFLGFAFEQLLSFQIWQKGFNLLFNPKAKVLHFIHKESTGRFYARPKRAALRDAEYVLTYLSLKSKVKAISWPAYALGVSQLILARILRAKNYGPIVSIYRVYGLLHGFVITNSSIISGTLGGKFSIRNSLAKLL